MPNNWLLTLAPVAGLGADLAVQIAFLKASRRLPASIVTGAFAGLVASAAVTALALTGLRDFASVVAAWILSLVTYCALAFGYWAFLNLNVTSLRIRILREILQANASISVEELKARYSGEEFLRRRLERLELGSRQLIHEGGRWRLNKRTLLVIAGILSALRDAMIPRQRRTP